MVKLTSLPPTGKKLQITSEMQLGLVIDDFVLKEQRKAVNENAKGGLIRQHTMLIKRKRGKYKDEQEVGPTVMITTAATVR